MSKNKLNMRNVFAIAICFTGMIMFSGCEKYQNNGNDGFPLGTDNWNSIACIARINGNSSGWNVCIMDKDGNNMRKIVDKSFGFPIPTRSNLGDQLLFSMDGLYFVGTDGTGLTLIEGANGNAGWSPDDKQIVYVKYSGDSQETSDLFLYNIADKTHTILQANGNDKAWVHFSPDGKKIAYSAHNGGSTNIYTLDVDGENNQLLIQNGYCPIWSPKGDKIAYLSFGKDRSSQIFVANADGSAQKQLTSTVSPEWWDTGFPRDGNDSPRWTPDGRKIVYVSWENGKSEIFIMNADGSGQTRLTKAKYRDEYPEVTPDGNYILFTSKRSNMMNSGIVIMSLDGSNQRVISKTGICPVACK
jgi:TolB protein